MSASNDMLLARALADAAGKAILPFFRAPFDTDFKADNSPVVRCRT